MKKPTQEQMAAVFEKCKARSNIAIQTMSEEIIKERLATLLSSKAAMLEFEQTLLAFDFIIHQANDPMMVEVSKTFFMAVQCTIAAGALEKLLKRT